jgi:hypothetical protein
MLDELCGRIRQALSLSRETTVQAGAKGGVSAPTVLEVPMSLGARHTQASEEADAALDPAASARNAAASAAVTLFTHTGAAGHGGEVSSRGTKGKRRKNKATAAAENEGKAAAPSQEVDDIPATTVAAAAAAHLNVAKRKSCANGTGYNSQAIQSGYSTCSIFIVEFHRPLFSISQCKYPPRSPASSEML